MTGELEENVDKLSRLAGELGLSGTPVFVFHEGGDETAGRAFRQIAKLSGGAYCSFDAGSASQVASRLAVASSANTSRPPRSPAPRLASPSPGSRTPRLPPLCQRQEAAPSTFLSRPWARYRVSWNRGQASPEKAVRPSMSDGALGRTKACRCQKRHGNSHVFSHPFDPSEPGELRLRRGLPARPTPWPSGRLQPIIPSAQLRVTFLPSLAHVQRDPPPAAISEGPHAVSVLFAKPRSELGHSLLPLVRHQHALVDHEARLAAVLDIEHGAHVGRAESREALVGPTKRVGRRGRRCPASGSDRPDPAALAPARRARRRRCDAS